MSHVSEINWEKYKRAFTSDGTMLCVRSSPGREEFVSRSSSTVATRMFFNVKSHCRRTPPHTAHTDDGPYNYYLLTIYVYWARIYGQCERNANRKITTSKSHCRRVRRGGGSTRATSIGGKKSFGDGKSERDKRTGRAERTTRDRTQH